MSNFSTYTSPFSWRYGSLPMRQLWSEEHKHLLWRKIWVALASAQSNFGLVTTEQVDDLRIHMEQIDLSHTGEVEARIHHDLMAELQVFADQCPLGGAILHLGATSADIEDNADSIRIRDAQLIIKQSLSKLLLALADRIDAWSDLAVMGYTHFQPAEPTTLGYRLAFTAEDLLALWVELDRLNIRGKGFKGAVGTAAAYTQLIGIEKFVAFEAQLSNSLGIEFFPVTTQIYPRRQEFTVISILAAIGAALNKFAFDLRLLQSPLSMGLSESFGKEQVGSSAMPFKRNPIKAEKIDSLARQLAQFPRLAWDNAAFSGLERTLDDSANRRILLPEAFLTTDEIINVSIELVNGIEINQKILQQNLKSFAPFSAIEPILMELVRAGANRQAMHSLLRAHALRAWEDVRAGKSNQLTTVLTSDPEITRYLPSDKVQSLLDTSNYLGIAPQRARATASRIRETFR